MTNRVATEIQYLECLAQDPAASSGVWDILKLVDQEFVPPLSAREGTKDVVFGKDSKVIAEPHQYFATMSQQPVFLARIGPEIAGFLSFRRDYPYDAAAFRSSAYVTTIAVAPAFRGRGVANALYEAIEDYVRQAEPNGIISVRSWSSNSSHLRLLESRGYETRLQLSEDRGPGVDTVIVAKAV